MFSRDAIAAFEVGLWKGLPLEGLVAREGKQLGMRELSLDGAKMVARSIIMGLQEREIVGSISE